VLDLTRLLPGGLCTLLFADLGAEVIKIEEPGRGDYLRSFPPIMDGESALFLALNRGKKSIAINLKNDAGRTILIDLARRADVLIEGFRPGVLERLGLGWEVLHEVCPRLVVCAISGYGQQGPLAQQAGHDLNYMATAGALSLFTQRGGGQPHVPGLQIADLGGGALPAAIGVLAALLERERTGTGSFVDISMTDGVLQWLALNAAQHAAGAAPVGGRSMLIGGAACYSVYETADSRYLTLAAVEERFWTTFCQMVERDMFVAQQWADWPQQEAMFADLDALFRSKTSDEWLAFFGDADVCVAPVLAIDEALAAAQKRGEGRTLPFKRGNQQMTLPGGLLGYSEATGPAPGLGQHTAAILAALGYSSLSVDALRRKGVVSG
jgi:crotonobetainyl-CoA:carnitine CoA-transferase CaiB-like acyl-CoA transferase